MNWDYIAGFFDGEGNVHIAKTKKNQLAIYIRIYQGSKEVLEEIRKFIGYGQIYQKKSTEVFELNFSKKDNVKDFLLNIKDKVILKKGQVNYVLENYKFDRVSNQNFDVNKFRSFLVRRDVERHRKLHTK
jgi:hypothetical protein